MNPAKTKIYLASSVMFVVVIFTLIFSHSTKSQTGAATLNLYAMSEYFPDIVIKEFEQKFNAKVRYDNFSNNEELLAKLQAGASGYDVIVPSDYMIMALIKNGLIQRLRASHIPNLKNLGSDFKNLPYDKSGEYSVPYMWGTTGIVYNSKFVKDPSESWDLLFKSEYKGRISLLEDVREALGMAMHKLGYSGNSKNKKEIHQAEVLLAKLKPNVRIFTADPKQHLQSEDIWIAQTYSGDAMMTSRSKPELKYIVPREGATLWIDNLAIPSGARNPELAHEFINFILEPRIAEILAKALLYSSPNESAEDLIENEILRASYIKKIKNPKLELLSDLGPDMHLWDDAWTKIKSQ